MSQNEIVRFALNNRWLGEQGVPDLNAPAAVAALQNAKPDRMDGGTESKPSGLHFTTGQRPESDWNRPEQCPGRCSASEKMRSHPAWTEARSQSRTQGGVGPGS
jgi:hypothetical protein